MRRRSVAGSIRLSESPCRGNAGIEAAPPSSSVSANTAANSAALACAGIVLRAAIASGSSSRFQSRLLPSSAATVAPAAGRRSERNTR